MAMEWIVGIDEAGRGALAGPVAVGAVMVPYDFDWDLIPGVGDSKKIAPKNREAIFRRAQELRKEGLLYTAVALIVHTAIDSHGITEAVRRGINKTLLSLDPEPNSTLIKLDGLLTAPDCFKHQETIIRGDATEKEIGLASIMAKVTRDRHIVRIAKKYPHYNFEVHKGYGTSFHRKMIKAHGMSAIHRTTFCRGCQ
jgi:ribonuclease HII